MPKQKQKRTRRNHTVEQKAALLKRHHLEKTPISDLCDEEKLQPSLFYTWQRLLFENAALALDAFAVSIRKVIGSYVALLGGVDLLVFSGGIGEHSERIRREATKGLEIIGVTPQKIQVIPTEEEMQIARHCRRMMQA